ncbi:MAG: hypothetical protein AB7Y46_19520 [Armatimonadota bacterium]
MELNRMRYLVCLSLIAAALFAARGAYAQGTISMYFIGPFEGDVTVKDYQTPGPPGYYYHPEPTRYPSSAQYYDHPVRCDGCGHWRELGKACPVCGKQPAQNERLEARRGTVYSPYAIPGQYWYDKPMRSMTGPRVGMGWPYLSERYR